ncbi:restriction endonuclease subunit S [Pantoea sp. BIGb0393]|uniref:Restriction endonuclease subunit S n=1 Tax=Pantoea nemavictus TaxID=2726955 RepID=A0ABU8PP86_9GAMM|nr:restriction endonuclease subunit S [Pantoea nemavictus]MBA0035564.1 restriction endonuclease subunit S [Pantoea nemavictus]
MVATSLPWLIVQLGEVVPYGKTEKCELSDVTSDTWILELEDIEKDSSKIIQRLDASARPFKSTKNKFSKGDVLYGKLRPYLNKVVIADNSGVCSTEIIPLNAEPNICNRYLFYWLKNDKFIDYVNSVSYGVNMPRLGTQDGLVAPFVLAPLAEQKVIADKLDMLLAKVGSSKARLERIPEILKIFRQSVLTSAVNGKLTEAWRTLNSKLESKVRELPENNKTRRGLPDRVAFPDALNESNFPESWDVLSVASLLRKGAIIDIKDGNHGANHPKSLEFTEEGLPFITAAQMSEHGKIDYAGAPKISGKPLEKLKVGFSQAEDVIYSHKGTVGRVSIADRASVLSPQTTYIRLNQKYISNSYYSLMLKSYAFTSQVDAIKSQTTRDFVPITAHYSLFAVIPSIDEQIEIARRVEELFAYAEKIEQKIIYGLERVNNLTQSILAKAFRGELTADWRAANPELISGDNSAKALLEKIKAKREAIERQPKPKRCVIKKKTGSRMSRQIIKVVEALKQAGEPLSGQQLLAAAGYPSDSSTDQLEQFFLDVREALIIEESIVKLERGDDSQDWFALAKPPMNKAKS